MTRTEENYLRTILLLSPDEQPVGTNHLAAHLQTTPASVTDMIKKLHYKKFVEYYRYRGVRLTAEGTKTGIDLLRRFRLWRTFLSLKLKYDWSEIDNLADELEHVFSFTFYQKLDAYLYFPSFDPLGEPIPDENGVFRLLSDTQISLADMNIGEKMRLECIRPASPAFLNLLSKLNIELNKELTIQEVYEYENLMKVRINNTEIIIGEEVSRNLHGKKLPMQTAV